jgi:hypothetical protein
MMSSMAQCKGHNTSSPKYPVGSSFFYQYYYSHAYYVVGLEARPTCPVCLHLSTCSFMKEKHPAREQDTSPILLFQVDDIIMPNTSDRIHVYLIGGLLSTSNLSLSWSERSAKYRNSGAFSPIRIEG